MAGEVIELALDGGAQAWRNVICMLLEAGIDRVPAREPERVHAPQRETLSGKVQARHGLPNGGAMHHLGAPDPHTLQKGDQSRGASGKLTQTLSLGVAHRRRAADA